jgi:hypothetical protein
LEAAFIGSPTVFAICSGYEDADALDDQRTDPTFKLA